MAERHSAWLVAGLLIVAWECLRCSSGNGREDGAVEDTDSESGTDGDQESADDAGPDILPDDVAEDDANADGETRDADGREGDTDADGSAS